MRFVERISQNKFVEILLTVLVYCVYAAVIAVSLAPSVWLLIRFVPPLVSGSSGGSVMTAVLVSGLLAASVYGYVLVGSVIQAAVVRLLSLGIRPGRYPAASFTTIRWLIYSGVYTISTRTILPLVPVTFVTNMYFRIVGCRMGRNVRLNTCMLNDAYLLTIGDNVVIGAQTDVSCHLFENNHLTLKPVHIGADTLIGAHGYISPGVRIGRRCVIGLHTYIRSDHEIPDGSVVTSLAAIDRRTAREIEKRRKNPHPSRDSTERRA